MSSAAFLSAADAAADPATREALLTAARVELLRESIAACTRCVLSSTAFRRVPWKAGLLPVAVVGEAPGAQEDALGEPFVGPAGKLLSDSLRQAGLSREDVWLVNTICCRPPRNDYDEAVRVGAVEACDPWWQAQLRESGAWLVVVCGARALAKFRPNVNVSAVRGRPWWQDGRLILPTWHPAFVLRNMAASTRNEFVADLQLARRILDGETEFRTPARYRLDAELSTLSPTVTDPEAAQFAVHFRRYGWVALFSAVLQSVVVLVADDEGVAVDPAYSRFPRYTLAEVAKMGGMTVADLRRVHLVKMELGGVVVS